MSAPACAHRLRADIADAEPRLRAITEDASARRPAPGKWSPREIIGHLIDSASNNHQRFVRATWMDNLIFPGYEQDGWVEVQRYNEASWSDLVTLWATFNRHLANVMASIPAEVRDRVHTRHNFDDIATRAPTSPDQVTLGYFMDDYAFHLEHHLRQVFGVEWTPSASRK